MPSLSRGLVDMEPALDRPIPPAPSARCQARARRRATDDTERQLGARRRGVRTAAVDATIGISVRSIAVTWGSHGGPG